MTKEPNPIQELFSIDQEHSWGVCRGIRVVLRAREIRANLYVDEAFSSNMPGTFFNFFCRKVSPRFYYDTHLIKQFLSKVDRGEINET